MAILTRKQPVSTADKLRGHAATAATLARGQAATAANKAVPLAQQAAQQAAPMARSAGTSVKAGTDTAIAWATPYVDAARTWAAPQIEQSARALSDTIAPKISDALVTAAHKIDATPAKRGRHRGQLVTAALLTALAGGLAVIALRMRRQADSFSASAMPAEVIHPEDDGPDPDLNGHSKIV